MQGVNIAKASAAREKLLEAIQELTETGEIIWLPRISGYEGTKFFTYIHLVTDALGWVAFGFGTQDAKLEFDTSKASDNLSLAIAHQQGRSWGGPNGRNPVQDQYARELAARRTTGNRAEEANSKERYFVNVDELGESKRREAERLVNRTAKLEVNSPEWIANIRRLTELRILTTPVALLLVHAASGDLNAEQTKEAESYGIFGHFLQLRAEIKGESGKA